ncbi:flavin reductase family protein [Tomitella fengzijianii]|uniref:Flavin reductase family protein n=1 Tax=Tomitella fengzijianii TaxID=2597660 RepID=A0A516X7Y2_9ACTN|nr:flavin reductase family protein [Tomitella fengzijianii]
MRDFESIAASLNQPMYVVTTRHGEERAGCLVGFGCQVSIAPARFLVCLSDKNHTYRLTRRATRLAVHVLGPHQHRLARLFGTETGDRVDKFARCAWKPDAHGVPILGEARAWFSGPITATTVFGDHEGFVVAPDAAAVAGPVEDLLGMHDVLYLDPGHPA